MSGRWLPRVRVLVQAPDMTLAAHATPPRCYCFTTHCFFQPTAEKFVYQYETWCSDRCIHCHDGLHSLGGVRPGLLPFLFSHFGGDGPGLLPLVSQSLGDVHCIRSLLTHY